MELEVQAWEYHERMMDNDDMDLGSELGTSSDCEESESESTGETEYDFADVSENEGEWDMVDELLVYA